MKGYRCAALIILIALIAGCRPQGGDTLTVTPVHLEGLAASHTATAGAPREMDFAEIDAHLEQLRSGRYEVTLTAAGINPETDASLTGETGAEVKFVAKGPSRHATIYARGPLFAPNGEVKREIVRAGPYEWTVEGGLCEGEVVAPGAELMGNASAGQLVGGVTLGIPTGEKDTINGILARAYTFDSTGANIPNLIATPESRLSVEGEVWIAEGLNPVVVRYRATLELANIQLFGQTFTGTLESRYDLYDVDAPFNITAPYGCALPEGAQEGS